MVAAFHGSCSWGLRDCRTRHRQAGASAGPQAPLGSQEAPGCLMWAGQTQSLGCHALDSGMVDQLIAALSFAAAWCSCLVLAAVVCRADQGWMSRGYTEWCLLVGALWCCLSSVLLSYMHTCSCRACTDCVSLCT